MSNITVDTFRSWKGNLTDPADPVVQAALDAAEEAIDAHCARTFAVAGNTSSARLYVGGSDVLRIHDCTEIVAVTIDGTAVAASAYQAEPVNSLTAAVAYSPLTQLRHLSSVWPYAHGKASISVDAKWGWSALPSRYRDAVLIMAADLLEQREIRNGIVGFTEYASIRVRTNPTVMSLLSQLRRSESWGIA